MRLHDTARGEVRELELREPGKVSMYHCGPTPYDIPHIGHGRNALFYDLLHRYLEWRGFDVTLVSNVTDIEDKIIRRANEEGRSCDEVVAQFEAIHWDSLDRLGILRPDHIPHATEYVERMVALIGELIARGHAYETTDGVYFEVKTLPGYGVLARQPLESLRAGARVDIDEDKREWFDFALWKKAKPGEPTWESPWGSGRPGWHIECTVMSLDLLGDGFDLHTAGDDLTFPHHENERAQAVGAGHAFARHWTHHGMIEIGGAKMSKSLKNFTSLTDLLDQHDSRAYRLLLLGAHYRSPVEVTPDTLAQAEAGLDRLDAFARKFANVVAPPDPDVVARFTALMDDDLKTPGALAVVFDAVSAAYKGDERAAATVFELAGALGLVLERSPVAIDAETQRLVDERDAARQARDFAKADAIRAQLEGMGWVVEDGPDGTVVHR
ncbi:MAG TPA: cysteine--tRNA ligase [Acidimicrobiales bacterium]|nr:cysteine--tRNA ligase [Acidimicrobiales bacterium]